VTFNAQTAINNSAYYKTESFNANTSINLTAATFNSNTSVITTNATCYSNSTSVNTAFDFITITSNPYVNNDIVRYYVPASNTVIPGLANNTQYFIVNATSTAIQLSSTLGGVALNIDASAIDEIHYFNKSHINITSNPYSNGQSVTYRTSSGNTALTGLANNTAYFVIAANSSSLRLSATLDGLPTTLSKVSGTTNSGHNLLKSFMSIPNNLFVNGDFIAAYVTGAGNTALTGLANNGSYYVAGANSSGFHLSNTLNGVWNYFVPSTVSETGHTFIKYDTSNYSITIDNSLPKFKNGDTVLYYTNAGNTVISGLSNNSLYLIASANTVGIKLANTINGNIIGLSGGLSEVGHNIALQNPAYYFAVSKHTQWPNESVPNVPADALEDIRDFQREMLFGKRISSSDVAYMIRKINWAANTVFDHYDDLDLNLLDGTSLYDKNFYVLTADNRVYKCLDNNLNGYTLSGNAPSETTSNTFMTSDGYVWKYMYTLSSANNVKFSTANYIPIDIDSTVTASASNGSIETIHVNSIGSGYITTTNGTIQQVISPTVFKIEQSTSSTQNNFYNSSSLYITSGSGAGQISKISQYIANSLGHYILTQNTMTGVATTSNYYISPSVDIVGDGSGAKAYCTVNTDLSTYSISKVNVLNSGINYTYADVSIVANTSYGSGAVLRAVTSPEGGHGSNVPAELGARYVVLATTFANNEGATISTLNSFRQAGIVYDPKKYANSSQSYTGNTFNGVYKLSVSTGITPFVAGESILGLSSNTECVVVYANSIYMEVTSKRGIPVLNETIAGTQTSAIATVSSINNPDINRFNSRVLFLDNFTSVTRSNTTSEAVKLLINI
jgi:hypothetical protein